MPNGVLPTRMREMSVVSKLILGIQYRCLIIEYRDRTIQVVGNLILGIQDDV